MTIDDIVKSAVAMATLEFQESVETETQRIKDERDIIIRFAHIYALEKCIPKLLESALSHALNQIIKE